jgi:hypothetical protein
MFRHTRSFDSQWKDIDCDDDDLMELQKEILADPQKSPVIPGTGGVRKIRVPLESRGKRSGARVLYGDFPEHGIVYLFSAYPKGTKENIDSDEKKALKALMNQINNSWRNRK